MYFLCTVCVNRFPPSIFSQVLYKHEGQSALKVLDKGKTSVTLPLPKDNGYVVLEIRSWGEGGDGAAQETIVSRDSGETWTDWVCPNNIFFLIKCTLVHYFP